MNRAVCSNVATVVVASLACLLVIEVVVRVFNLAPALGANANTGLSSLLRFDAELESRYRADATARITSPYGEYDVIYRTNGLGLRDRPIEQRKIDERRILMLGNSFVEGWGLKEQDDIPQVVERELASLDGQPVRVVNGGVAGYGAIQSYLHAKKIWNEVGPDVVVLVLVGTMVSADQKFAAIAATGEDGLATGLSADALLAGGAKPKEHPSSTTRFFENIGRYSATVRLVVQRIANHRAIDAIKEGDPSSDMLAAYRSGPVRLEELFQPTLRHVLALSDYTRAHGKKFVLVHLPMPFQISDDAWKEGRKAYKLRGIFANGRELALVKQFCSVNELKCLFADDILAAETRKKPNENLFYIYDFHLDAAGAKLVGDWLGGALAGEITVRAQP